jgi:integrase
MPKKIRGLYQRAGAGAWLYDLQIRGHRFCGSTGLANRRDAEKWLVQFKAARQVEAAELAGDAPMSFDVASTRWWTERGEARKDWKDMDRALAWLQTQIGRSTLIRAIDNNIVARLAAARRAEGASPATVNRSALEPLRAILTRAGEVWGQQTAKIDWRGHLLKETAERIRELSGAEEAALFAALRPDFHAVARFLLVTGLRRAEACRLKWSDVDLEGERMTVRGKGGTLAMLPLAAAAVAILRGERRRHKERVFTYEVRHEWGGKKGERAPIEPDTLSTAFWRARRAAGLAEADLRLHDLRHTMATRMGRATGNLQHVQKALGHKRLTTTARYAHVTEDDLRASLNKANPVATLVESPVENPAIEAEIKRKA